MIAVPISNNSNVRVQSLRIGSIISLNFGVAIDKIFTYCIKIVKICIQTVEIIFASR